MTEAQKRANDKYHAKLYHINLFLNKEKDIDIIRFLQDKNKTEIIKEAIRQYKIYD